MGGICRFARNVNRREICARTWAGEWVCAYIPHSTHHIITGASWASPETSTSVSKAVAEKVLVTPPPATMLNSVSSRRRIDGAMVLYRTCRTIRRLGRGVGDVCLLTVADDAGGPVEGWAGDFSRAPLGVYERRQKPRRDHAERSQNEASAMLAGGAVPCRHPPQKRRTFQQCDRFPASVTRRHV